MKEKNSRVRHKSRQDENKMWRASISIREIMRIQEEGEEYGAIKEKSQRKR